MELGEKIRSLRKLSGMTQEMLAEKLHITRQVLSKWENGNSQPDISTVIQLAEIFGITVDELLGVEKESEEPKLDIEDLIHINALQRKKTLYYMVAVILLAIGIMGSTIVITMNHYFNNVEYTLYRYLAVGEYAGSGFPMSKALVPCMGIGLIGILVLLLAQWKMGAGERSGLMKKLIYLLMGVVVIVCGVLTFGMGKSIRERSVCKEFLTLFFTSNYGDRYEQLYGADAESLDVKFYTSDFQKVASEHCIDTMLQNRDPIKYDGEAAEKGVSVIVKSIKLNKKEDDFYEYALQLEEKNGDQIQNKSVTGQLTLVDDEEPLVDGYYVGQFVDED